MKICFIGLGSIGRRHLKNIYEVLPLRGVEFTVDALRSLNKELAPEISGLVSSQYYDYASLPSDYEVAFISNPTILHYDTISNLMRKTKHMFIEKPLFDTYRYDTEKLIFGDGIYYIAAPLRYSSVIKWLSSYTQENRVHAARVICSTYLPDWRPGTDYRDCYSAKTLMGGGVRTDLIHEWDYLTYMFGFPINVSQYSGTYSDLEIDSDDAAVYIARYPDKLVSVHLDYFGKSPKREIELYTQDSTVIGDLIKNEVRFEPSGDRIELAQTRDQMQRAELEAFFDMVDGKVPNNNTPQTAMRTLRIALGGELN